MLTVLVTGPTVMQNSLLLPIAPRRDDQAELAWVVWLNTKTVIYPRINHHTSIQPMTWSQFLNAVAKANRKLRNN